MSRPPIATQATLAVFKATGRCTNETLMAAWEQPRAFVYERVKRLVAAGFVVRANPGTNPAVFKLTALGEAAADAALIPEAPKCPRKQVRPSRANQDMVINTLKTQPNSVFALASLS